MREQPRSRDLIEDFMARKNVWVTIAAAILVLGVAFHALALNGDHSGPVRIVVQDSKLSKLLAISKDRHIYVVVAQSMVEVIERGESPIVIFRRLFPEPVKAAAVSGDGQWICVATSQNVYRLDLASNELEVLVPQGKRIKI